MAQSLLKPVLKFPLAALARELFLALRSEYPEAFFFETSELKERKKQFCMIGLRAEKVLRRRGLKVELEADGKTENLSKNFFAALDDLAKSVGEDNSRRFSQGGLFGCIGFESVHDIEAAVPASDGDEISAEVFLSRDLILIDHESGELSYRGALAELACQRACSRLQPITSVIGKEDQLVASRVTASLGYEGFRERVAVLKEHIAAGNLFQAVLAERFEYQTSVLPTDIFSALYDRNPAAYTFYFSFSQCQFLGASPEALLKVKDGRALTHPIAGTKPRGENGVEDRRLAKSLRTSRKEAAEHLMLVDLARNDLGRVAKPGSVRVNFFRTLQRFTNVMHLVSEVQADLPEGLSALKAFAACFPAGTLSGAPKIRAMQILAELEKESRGLYGGAVIAFDPAANQLDSCIAIRCMEMRDGKAILRAGAGIVADSKPQAEYAEISHKLQSLRIAITTAELGQEVAQ